MRIVVAVLFSYWLLGICAAIAGVDDSRSGATLYAEHCASCHGANLEGQPNWRSPNSDGTLPAPPHDESGHTWHHGDLLLFKYVKLGGAAAVKELGVSSFRSGMPSFAGVLSDREIRDVLNFIKSHWSERARAHQKRVSETE